jgi:hypothetical protein
VQGEVPDWTTVMSEAIKTLLNKVCELFKAKGTGLWPSVTISNEEISSIQSSTQKQFQLIYDINALYDIYDGRLLILKFREFSIIPEELRGSFITLWGYWKLALRTDDLNNVLALIDKIAAFGHNFELNDPSQSVQLKVFSTQNAFDSIYQDAVKCEIDIPQLKRLMCLNLCVNVSESYPVADLIGLFDDVWSGWIAGRGTGRALR